MHRTDEPSLVPLRGEGTVSSRDLGTRCLLDSYRVVRRIQSGCEQTTEMCRRQRRMIEEQREYLEGLRRAFAADLREGVAAPAGDGPGRGFDGGARAVE